MPGRRAALFAVVLLGVVARGGVIAQRYDELAEDRDAYLGLADGLAHGRGYSVPGSRRPTAYRPPLYPLVLAPGMLGGVASIWTAAINLASGAATVLLTWRLAVLLGLGDHAATAAAAVVAVDPLLVRYSSQPMTESLATLLLTAWLLMLTRTQLDRRATSAAACGLLFGLCALCRPTVWASGLLIAAWWLVRRWLSAKPHWSVPLCAAGAAGCLATVSPWAIRNAIHFGAQIVTTTHGGYTLLLGNNPSYYDEVVRQNWGTTWDGSHGIGQAKWLKLVQAEMAADGVTGEVRQDRWMTHRAINNIRADVTGFLTASALRFTSFWGLVPHGDARRGWSWWMIRGVAGFYIVVWSAALVGLVMVLRQSRAVETSDAAASTHASRWTPPLLVVLSFVAVHLVYWSNARMRAPVTPVVAILAIQGMIPLTRKRLPIDEPARVSEPSLA